MKEDEIYDNIYECTKLVTITSALKLTTLMIIVNIMIYCIPYQYERNIMDVDINVEQQITEEQIKGIR